MKGETKQTREKGGKLVALTHTSVSLWTLFNLLILAMVAYTFAYIISIFLATSLTTVSHHFTDLFHSLLL